MESAFFFLVYGFGISVLETKLMCCGLYHYLHISSIHSARLTNGRVADAYNEKQGFDPFNQLTICPVT
jgi:hypothetical protein